MGYDVSKNKSSVAGKVESLIGRMADMGFEQIREEFTSVIDDPETHASSATRSKWKSVIAKSYNKKSLMTAITNLYLKGAQLGL